MKPVEEVAVPKGGRIRGSSLYWDMTEYPSACTGQEKLLSTHDPGSHWVPQCSLWKGPPKTDHLSLAALKSQYKTAHMVVYNMITLTQIQISPHRIEVV